MVGLLYLKVKRNWRAWLRVAALKAQSQFLLKRVKDGDKEAGVIVSLTTFGARIKGVNDVLRSIVIGKVLPAGIYLYLDEKTYNAIIAQESFLMKLVKLDFVHLKVVDDVRSYNKLVFALTDHPEKYIVICDDDVLYPKYWLSGLINGAKKWADSKVIVCHRAHEVCLNEDGSFKPYSEWPKEITNLKKPSKKVFPTGTGGVIYPPKSLPSITVNSAVFKKYAPTADDIWFWFCALSNDNKFMLTDEKFNSRKFLDVPGSQTSNLFSINVNGNANDSQIKNTSDFFQNKTHLFSSAD